MAGNERTPEEMYAASLRNADRAERRRKAKAKKRAAAAAAGKRNWEITVELSEQQAKFPLLCSLPKITYLLLII